jgi:DNA-directed RNA polymerase alpha subunit
MTDPIMCRQVVLVMDVPEDTPADEIVSMFNMQVMEMALQSKLLVDWTWHQSDAVREIQPIAIYGNNPWGVEDGTRFRIPIERLDLTVRAYNCLKREGIHTTDDLCRLYYSDLLNIKNLGVKSADDIVVQLGKAGFSLKVRP